MTKLNSVLMTTMFGLLLTACDGSTTPPNKPVDPEPVVGNAANGLVFYQSQCSACHAAGSDDITTAFNAIDLRSLKRQNELDKIKNDMSTRGGIIVNNAEIVPLMGRFKHVSDQRVADLKAYIENL